MDNNLYKYVLRLADSSLILSHRLSEYCSKGPFLEEDLAISNVSLDLLGQAESLLIYAAEMNNDVPDADFLAFRRDEREFLNFQLCELENGDYAHLMARQLFVDVFNNLVFPELAKSKDERIAGIAAKSVKEVRYHLKRSSEWMKRLGLGTEESHTRIQQAINDLWVYTGEMFESRDIDKAMAEQGIGVEFSTLHTAWYNQVKDILSASDIETPPFDTYYASGSWEGIHTENLGFLLTDMQFLPTRYPDATW